MKPQTEDNIFDNQGFRFNVAILLLNGSGDKAFWAKRIGADSWQFPQGGLRAGESDLQSAYREIYEELGLEADDVEVIGKTPSWFKYRLPVRFRRPRRQGHNQCVGQKQRWYLMRLNCSEDKINLNATDEPEFERWTWHDYWQACQDVVHFKRKVYRQALDELAFFFPHLLRSKSESNQL